MTDTTPIYNLKAVIHEVGLSAATLRAWEGRYGLPKPQRTAGGHRLYSRQDIEMLKWLIAKQQEGLSISRAVEMWKTLQAETQYPTAQVITPALDKLSSEAIFDELREDWIAACLDFNDRSANQILDQAFAIAAPETICTEVLQKGLAEIGNRWYTGKLIVQQEHFASAIALRRINSLIAAVIPPTRKGRILAACPPGEQHDFILLLSTYLLRRNGWDVVYLGSNVPLRNLDLTIQSTTPELLISAAQTINSAASLRVLSEANIMQDISLAFGGGVFNTIPPLTRFISGHYLGADLTMLPQEVERLMKSQLPAPPAQPVPLDHTLALAKFVQNESKIASDVSSALQVGTIDPNYLQMASLEFGRMISSVLILGDINLLDYSLDWLNGLLNNYGFSLTAVHQFYSVYQDAVERHLGDGGLVISNWLKKQANVE
jgi:MerR family transcriptional regulator, light-induced transcriptional regulator